MHFRKSVILLSYIQMFVLIYASSFSGKGLSLLQLLVGDLKNVEKLCLAFAYGACSILLPPNVRCYHIRKGLPQSKQQVWSIGQVCIS